MKILKGDVLSIFKTWNQFKILCFCFHLFNHEVINDSNGTRSHDAKMTFVVRTYMYGALDCMLLSCQVRVSEWIHRLKLPECQGTPCWRLAWYLKFKWQQRDSNLVCNRLVCKQTFKHLAKLTKCMYIYIKRDVVFTRWGCKTFQIVF